MSKEQLQQTLTRLRADLDTLRFRHPASRARMEALIAGIEEQLRNADDNSTPAPQLRDLSDSLTEFEVEHPQLTAALQRIISALSSMGI